jgi:glycosyltransferase involved in cell wall biosynthesis
MADLTAIILTKNEEKNIEKCIKSIIGITKRILVVDSFSDDRTVEIAQKNGAEVHEHIFENHSKQFIYALNALNIETKWVMRIDADEELTKTAADEIEKICNENTNTDVNGIVMRFEVNFMGKKLRHGGIYPFKKLNVFKYGIGYMEERNMDEHIVLRSGTYVELHSDCIHNDYKDLTYWINKHNWYASKEVLDYISNRNECENLEGYEAKAKFKRIVKYKIYYKLPMGARAHLYYWYRYYIKLGFLDGKEGKIYAFMQAYWYRFLVDAKIYERNIHNK